MTDLLRDLFGFVRHRRGFWLLPVIVVLVYLGLVLWLGAFTEIAPFIYTLY